MNPNKKDRKRNRIPAWRKRKLPKDMQDTPEFSVDLVTEVVAIYYEKVNNNTFVAAEVRWSGGSDVKKVLVEGPTIMNVIYDLIRRHVPFGQPFYGPGVAAPDPDEPKPGDNS